MSRKSAVILSIAALVLLVSWLLFSQHQRTDVDPSAVGSGLGYVATADRKVHAVDLRRGVVVRQSAPIADMGQPTAIAYVVAESLLFVASARGRGQNDYYPLVAVRPDVEFQVAGTYTPGGEALQTSAPNPNRSAIYTVVASPDARTLYLGLAQSGAPPTTLFDRASGAIVGRSSVPILPENYISPDGTRVAEVWPSGNRTVDEGGQRVLREWPAGVLVREIATGNVVSRHDLAGGQSLQPPWFVLSTPYVYIKPGTTELSVYNRATGEVTAGVDLQSLTGMTPVQATPIVVPDSGLVALSMVDSGGRGFVVVVDVAAERVSSRIEVGPMPTNVVLAE